jgi:5-methyltetrahydropteroyltriglutamate--homocysteine methyltransferase
MKLTRRAGLFRRTASLMRDTHEYVMKRSTDRILTTHAGSLPRPPDLLALVERDGPKAFDEPAAATRLSAAVADIVHQQTELGIDVIDDGEYGKPSFVSYINERLGGYEVDTVAGPRNQWASSREGVSFPEFYAQTHVASRHTHMVCTGPITYKGHGPLTRDIENLKAALGTVQVEEVFMPAISPSNIEDWQRNAYYKTQEEYVFAIAEAMREEYQAIVDAGFLLQIDDPDLPDGWACLPDITLRDYRKYATMRIDALNHALRDIPREKIRLHVCWGSFHGPHHDDIPLRDIIDLIFRVRAGSYSIEASNPCHEHEWRVFEEVKLPEGATLIPGVVGHCTDFIEHPDLVAERLVRYANLVGRENVLAGTDCGLGTRVGHPSICWAKFEAMAEGARRATKTLWGRA